MERQEKQISATAAARSDAKTSTDKPHTKPYHSMHRQATKPKKDDPPHNPNNSKSSKPKPPQTSKYQVQIESEQYRRGCWLCGSSTHLARNCRQPRAEASGRSGQVSRTAQLTATRQPPSVEDMTEEQLEALLSQRRLAKEKQLLAEGTQSSVNTVTAKPTKVGDAVGPTMYIDLEIEGVKVEAMVDTGAQSTIISRALLHEVANNLKAQGRPVPELEKPCARLFGKSATVSSQSWISLHKSH